MRHLYEKLGIKPFKERELKWLEKDREDRTKRRKRAQIAAATKKGKKRGEVYGL